MLMQNYSTIIGVIDLRLKDISYRDVQRRHGVGSSTVTLIMSRFKEIGCTLDELKGMEPDVVTSLVYPPETRRRKDVPLPDFEKIHQRMVEMGKRADLSYLWLTYKEDNPDGYQLSQFYKLYGDFQERNYGGKKASMPVERIPGEKLYLDWVGDQPELLIIPGTGEIKKVHVFAATLAFSSKVYAEVFADEKMPSFITGTVNALSAYGALPKHLVPDNLKAAVTKHTKDELVLSSAYSDLEDFYDVIVLPPPSGKPKGKSTVENHVRYLEVHLVEKLKEGAYTSLEALNEATRQIVAAINERPFKDRSDIRDSRNMAFEKYDRPQMRPLPGGTYQACDYKYFLRIPDNYHLEYDGHYYSVSYTLRGKPAILKATMSEIRICDEANRLICTHPRSYKAFPRYITEDAHMRPEHLYNKELNVNDGAYYRRWATALGPFMATLIDRVLKSAKHEEQAYRSCAGILHMCKDVPRDVIEEVAAKCLEANAAKYTYFKRALNQAGAARSEGGALRDKRLPEHDNIRGKGYYQ
jgi:transposase